MATAVFSARWRLTARRAWYCLRYYRVNRDSQSPRQSCCEGSARGRPAHRAFFRFPPPSPRPRNRGMGSRFRASGRSLLRDVQGPSQSFDSRPLAGKYPLFSRIALAEDLPEENLRRGDVATIVEYYEGHAGKEP